MRADRMWVAAAIILVASGMAGGGTALAADAASLVLPFGKTVTKSLSAIGAPGAVIQACPAGSPQPGLFTIGCQAGSDSVAVSSISYNPDVKSAPFDITVLQADGVTPMQLTVTVQMTPPDAPTADSFDFGFPVSQGTVTLFPASTFASHIQCVGCAGATPLFSAGAVSPAAAGVWGAPSDLGNGVLQFGPSPDYTGSVSLSYTVSDPYGNSSQRATIRVEVVAAASSAPIVQPDIFITTGAAPVKGNLLANDSDPQGLKLELVSCDAPKNGTVQCKSDGTMVYTAAAGFSGTDQFGYHVVNSKGDQANGVVQVAIAKDGAVVTSTATATVSGPATTVVGPGTTVTGPATTVSGLSTTVSGPATTVSGPATTVQGAPVTSTVSTSTTITVQNEQVAVPSIAKLGSPILAPPPLNGMFHAMNDALAAVARESRSVENASGSLSGSSNTADGAQAAEGLSGDLAYTGVPIQPSVLWALGLLVSGCVFLIAVRQRRSGSHRAHR
ncbi:hypothetical protein EH165_12510 [Nakamurella antarctica]|uniref:Uncharacterized protein n=1 Tax=Nakamurella antarctica TaxID=1902245 RepID=A0A3G8ZNY2_9ACTN|nr:Ig-like domain-containing protein [Nakamurella antarctica]AZI58838.1 hypothetical protein EH165_12510 [Nakamurella antarctica]